MLLVTVLATATGCRRSSGDETGIPIATTGTAVPELLPLWTLRIEQAFGEDSTSGPGWTDPVPLGSDLAGNVYVIDPYLGEIHRFDFHGHYSGVAVGRGEGPGEIRSRPWTFGLAPQGLWFTELATGRVHYVPNDGSPAFTTSSGYTHLRLGARSLRIFPASGWHPATYILQAVFEHGLGSALQPRQTVVLMRSRGSALDTTLTYSAISPSLRLDGGRTFIQSPAPNANPVLLADRSMERFILISRPINAATGESSRIVIRILNSDGDTTRTGSLLVPRSRLSQAHRDSLLEVLLTNATLGGSRKVTPGVESSLRAYVLGLGAELPGFEDATLGPNHTIWLLESVPPIGASAAQRWLVADSTLSPIARVAVPPNLTSLEFMPDGYWWGTLNRFTNPIVVRMSLQGEPKN